MELRAEFLNALNFTNFGNPINNLSSPLSGTIVTTTTGPRTVQIGLKIAF
jgi:hypothetical protein